MHLRKISCLVVPKLSIWVWPRRWDFSRRAHRWGCEQREAQCDRFRRPPWQHNHLLGSWSEMMFDNHCRRSQAWRAWLEKKRKLKSFINTGNQELKLFLSLRDYTPLKIDTIVKGKACHTGFKLFFWLHRRRKILRLFEMVLMVSQLFKIYLPFWLSSKRFFFIISFLTGNSQTKFTNFLSCFIVDVWTNLFIAGNFLQQNVFHMSKLVRHFFMIDLDLSGKKSFACQNTE